MQVSRPPHRPHCNPHRAGNIETGGQNICSVSSWFFSSLSQGRGGVPGRAGFPVCFTDIIK